MDDIGNLIYLVVLLVSFVFGIWQKANKKKQDEGASESTLEEAFESFERDEPAPPRRQGAKPISQQEVIAKDEKAATRLREMEEKARRAKEEAGSIRRKARQRQMEVFNTEEEETTIDLDLSDIDARKAVIYSEILNPPYL